MFKDQYKEMSFINNMEIMDMTEKACMSSGLFLTISTARKTWQATWRTWAMPAREKKASTTS
ncbi:MAG: hypothetical protein ACLR6B_00615 [Blautia sp.]